MGAPAAWSLLALVGLAALLFCAPLAAANALAPVDEEWGEAQEVTLTMEDIGYDADGTRNELRYVGSCWSSFMVECVRECQAFKNATIEGIRNEGAPAAAVAVVEALVEAREEICAGQCQASVSFRCSELNALHDGVQVFKYGGRWPFKVVCGIREAVSAGAALVSALLCAATFSKVLRSIRRPLSKPSLRTGAEARGSELEPGCTAAEDGASCVLVMSFIGCCAFAWQAAYHVVDIRLFKYFADLSAVAAFASFWYCGLCIATGTRVPVLHPSGARLGLVLSTIPLGFLLFMSHALYQDVDMGHVPLVMRICGVLQGVVWIWAMVRSRSPLVPARAIIKAELLAAGADALDFPPQMGLIDGHALCMVFVLGTVVTLATPILRVNVLGGPPAGSKPKEE